MRNYSITVECVEHKIKRNRQCVKGNAGLFKKKIKDDDTLILMLMITREDKAHITNICNKKKSIIV